MIASLLRQGCWVAKKIGLNFGVGAVGLEPGATGWHFLIVIVAAVES